ncbi:sensor histidine kinase [Bradyrhizobium iriomotense]|uniref:histidine kinase n=1 Tax=Bradyrhizobium iriomotense TaxID=441950 RepID=A0ABQ6B8W3_9BRAD|nr:ATP-binding protein [Bradyrhizobium iriomotense]GLR90834.1 histidine kinase [Bradyrhizobium iriomotense]
MRTLVLVWLLAVTATLAVAEPSPRTALVIDEPDPSSGIPTTFSATLRAALNNFRPSVAVFGETLDLKRFSGRKQEATLRTYVQQKYSDVRFGVIVAVGASALDLVRRWRSELWPDVPVVFAAIDEMTAARLEPDRNMTGLVMRRTIKSTMTVAHILVPDLKRLAVLGGSLTKDPYRLQYLKELPALAGQTELINLTGLPLNVQAARGASLPDKTAIFYTSLFIDDEGTRYSSPDALTVIARVANRPILVDVESLIGFGATGGFVLNNVAYGQEVAALAARILDDASVAANPIVVGEFTKPVFDWRQMQRWGISEHGLPPDTEIHFRETSVWHDYAWPIALTFGVIVLQGGLISLLLHERHRRRYAEVQSRQRMSELARVNRFSTAGELTASIAHEINQPLGAIQTNAETMELMLRSPSPDLEDLKEIAIDIRRDQDRASEVIRRLRSMLRKAPFESSDIDLNELVRETEEFLSALAVARQVELTNALALTPLPIKADRIQLQQVILNLIVNAMDAMSDIPVGKRKISIQTTRNDRLGEVSISDAGPGIPPDKAKQVFEAFFTTKAEGMGIGLSIARTIVEAHGGRIWADNQATGGAVFHISLPLAEGL